MRDSAAPSLPPPVHSLGVALAALAVVSACSGIPQDRYGVDRVRVLGNEVMDDEAIKACLATRERPRVILQLGAFSMPSCGSPPFTGHPVRIRLWRWGWTDWPLYDELLLEQDLERVLRWYEARGYPDASIVETRFEPASAADSDIVGEQTPCGAEDNDDGCEVTLVIVVDEGEPVHVTEIRMSGMKHLPLRLANSLRAAVQLELGQRFDEASYEASKREIEARLIEASYARNEITGQVRIDRSDRSVVVDFDIDTGPPCVIGELTVEGNEDLPALPIREAAALDAGDPYSASSLRDAQQAVYDLGALASVNIQPVVPDSGNEVDVVIDVVPARRTRFQVGAGVQSGLIQRQYTEELEQIPQWDIHLLGSWEHRNFLGGLRRFRIEERPRLVFEDAFPRAEEPQFGNLVTAEFSQPAFLEPRTNLSVTTRWDFGPDEFLRIPRHQIDSRIGVERYFWDRRIYATLGANESIYLNVSDELPPGGGEAPSSSHLFFLEQVVRLDLRNDPLRVRQGMFASLSVQEGGYLIPSSWDYVRLAPELRGYVHLGAGFVWASRVSFGWIFLSEADSRLDSDSQELGPTSQRFRGGGATSNRGFPPGELGDGPQGGVRRWLAATELRVPVTRDFSLALFADTGDVSRQREFRFDHPQLSVGLGLRLLTLVGPIRLDFGWRVPNAQVIGDTDRRDPGGSLTRVDLLLFEFPGAVQLTLGDSF